MRLFMATILCVVVSGSCATADFVNFASIADASIFDDGADGSFETINTSNTSLSIRYFPTLNPPNRFEERAIAEFNLSALPAGSTINGVTFQFEIVGYTSSSTRVDIYGYRGNGTTEVADATISAVLLGSYDPVALDLGPKSVTLNTAAFASLFATSPFIGLRFQGSGTMNTQISSLEGSMGTSRIAPTLVINTATASVPEPSSVVLMGLGVVALPLALRRARRIAV